MKTAGTCDVEDSQKILEVVGPAVRDRGRSHGVLQDQVPADDPGEEFARAWHTRRCKPIPPRGPWRRIPRSTAPRKTHVIPDTTKESISAGPVQIMRRDAGQDEDAGADDRADAQARKLDGAENAAQLILALEFLDERFVRLYLEQLIGHSSPS